MANRPVMPVLLTLDSALAVPGTGRVRHDLTSATRPLLAADDDELDDDDDLDDDDLDDDDLGDEDDVDDGADDSEESDDADEDFDDDLDEDDEDEDADEDDLTAQKHTPGRVH